MTVDMHPAFVVILALILVWYLRNRNPPPEWPSCCVEKG